MSKIIIHLFQIYSLLTVKSLNILFLQGKSLHRSRLGHVKVKGLGQGVHHNNLLKQNGQATFHNFR